MYFMPPFQLGRPKLRESKYTELSRLPDTSPHKTGLTSDISWRFRGSQNHSHFTPVGYKFGVLVTTLEFNNSLERLTQLRAALLMTMVL